MHEVAEASLAVDRHRKGSVYARAGLAEVFDASSRVAPLAVPGSSVLVSRLLP